MTKGLCLFQTIFLAIILTGCGTRDAPAPVEERQWRHPNTKRHIVSHGETLYAIAFRYDKDYRDLARINHIAYPYSIHKGDVIRLAKPGFIIPKPVVTTLKSKRQPSIGWIWPAKGKVMTSYDPKHGIKGINIAGNKGDKIYASEDGVVAYAGNGLSGYGNLIIIKHHFDYLTAYGNNAKNLVQEGQHIKKGQAIADMGIVGRKYFGVHFEIRKLGKPENPLKHLRGVG